MYLIYKCYNTRYHYNEGKEVTVSHVHKHHPFSARLGTGRAVLPAALVSILLSMCNCRIFDCLFGVFASIFHKFRELADFIQFFLCKLVSVKVGGDGGRRARQGETFLFINFLLFLA